MPTPIGEPQFREPSLPAGGSPVDTDRTAETDATRRGQSGALDALSGLSIARGAKPIVRYTGAARRGPLGPEQQALRLFMHAGAISRQPKDKQSAIFNAILIEVCRLPMDHRVRPLRRLTRQIGVLPEAHHEAAFKSAAHAIEGLDSNIRIGPFVALAEQIGTLPEDRRLAAIDDVIARSAQLPSEHKAQLLTVLAGQCDKSAKLAPDVFDRVRRAVRHLPAGHRAAPLEALVERLAKLPRGDRRDALETLVEMAEALPAKPGAGVLNAASHMIGALPPTQRLTAFGRLLRAIKRLPIDERGAPLATLANWLRWPRTDMSESERYSAFDEMVDIPVRESAPLFFLACLIEKFLDGRREAAFGRVLEAGKLLPPDKYRWVLDVLARKIHCLPADVRTKAFDDVKGKTSGLSDEAAAHVLYSLVFAIHSLPDEDKLGALGRLVDSYEQLPYSYFLHARPNLRTLISALPFDDQPAARARVRAVLRLHRGPFDSIP